MWCKKWKFLVFQKSILVSPLDRVLGTTPSLEVLVWYPVCTCYGISVTVRLCLKQKPNVCSALREVNCMLDIWSGVKDQRQACDMKCKSVFNFVLCFYFFHFIFFAISSFYVHICSRIHRKKCQIKTHTFNSQFCLPRKCVLPLPAIVCHS